MARVGPIGRTRAALAATILVAASMIVIVPIALAGTGMSISPSIPTGGGAVTVGATGIASSLLITNNSTSPENAGTISVTSATLTVVPGVFSLSLTGTPDASTPGCALSSWNITGGPTTYTFTPVSAVNLTSTHASPATLTFDCQINFTVDVLSRPATEPTAYGASVAGIWSGDNVTPASGSGSGTTTINKATPILTTTASGPVIIGATITDTAHLSGGFGTLTGSMAFSVYAPGDTNCGTPLAPAPTGNTVTAAADYTSGPFTTAAVGTYRWRAFFTDTDGNNNDVSTSCNDANESSTVTQNPSIAITKDPATQTILSGGTATWNIVVTNTGDVPLTNVNVSDPLAADCVKLFVGTLAPGASEALYTCTKASVTADFTNVATAHGTPPVGGEVTDSDSAAVDVISPLIVIIKGPNDQQVLPGGTATFSITVTNSGDVALTNVTVTDAQAPGCANSAIGTLAAGASTTYTCTLTNVTVDFTNTACVVGTPPLGPDVTDCDDANVDVIHPAITITKDPPTQTVASGGTATWTIVVTNTGDVALTSVNVTDPLAADCVKTFGGSLAPGASEAAYTCTKTNVTANFTNVATAHGTPAVGPEVTANDSADVVVPTGTGAILPTNTECSDFVNNTTPALAQINYTVSGGKIGQNINPGVFFYYTYVTTTIANEAITTSQHAGNSAPPFQLNQGHVWVYTANCTLVKKADQPAGATIVATTIAAPGTYVLRIQYSTKSIAGQTAPTASPTTYHFDINGTDNASVPLVLKP